MGIFKTGISRIRLDKTMIYHHVMIKTQQLNSKKKQIVI